MKRTVISAFALILVLSLLAGSLCMTASAATVFDDVSTFPASPFDFYTRLSMINNTLSVPYELEVTDPDEDAWIHVYIRSGDKVLATIDFDKTGSFSDGTPMRETMTTDSLFEKCDYINSHLLFKGDSEPDRWVETDVLEAQMLIQMACDPQMKRLEDADEVSRLMCDVIYSCPIGEGRERNGIVLELSCWASYGVMLDLRDAGTQALPTTHH